MKHQQTYIYFFILACLVFACAPQGEKIVTPTMPDSLITPDDMAKILTEIHLADAITLTEMTTLDTVLALMKSYNKSILLNHGVRDSVFIQNLDYYKLLPVEIDSIYAKIITNLNMLETSNRRQF
jgi:hypothetical protein